MKTICCLALLSLSVTSPAFGVLPPLYQTSAELKAVLGERDLGAYLPSGEPIVEIKKNDKGYEVITLRHSMQADVIYEPVNRPGPARFRIQYNEAKKLQDEKSKSDAATLPQR